ncbi:MAG: tetratricopeptide repeat protein [Spirochaetaceae bacterium]|nr:tetratricopeptide repeat protein [Spirochaetaceae bacterium]
MGGGDTGTNRYDQAIKDFDMALSLNPSFMEVYYNRGVMYAKKRNFSQAIEDFNRVLSLDPGYTDTAQVLEKLQD